MIAFPNCKINLGLHVIERRDDGFHNIETVYYPLPFYDIIAIVEDKKFSFHTSGIACTGGDDNLCVKAYRLLKKHFPYLPPIKMHLHKTIPQGAGLGGGSSDAAFTLQLLNSKFSLGLNNQQLQTYALLLGSDCPFFVLNEPCIAKGRGEKLKALPLSLKGYYIKLVLPGIHISTGEIFSKITPACSSNSLEEIMKLSPANWKGVLTNDFEVVVFSMFPQLEKIKEQLYLQGALYVSMSGTGSTMYGIFKDGNDTPVAGDYDFKLLVI